MNNKTQERTGNHNAEVERLKSLVAVVSCVSIAGISMGFTLPLMTLTLDRDGSSGLLIGLIGSILGIAIVVYSPIVPKCISMLGMRKYVLACMIAEALMFICLKLFPLPLHWIVIRFVMGMAVAGIFIATESWINHLARPETRGRVLAIFNISLGVGFAAGPMILIFTGTVGWPPFLTGAAITTVALIPLFFIKSPKMNLEEPSKFSPFAFIFIAPALCLAVVLTAGTETLMGSLFHYYSARIGYLEADMHKMLSLFFIGGIVFQYPIGWLADHINIRKLLLALGLICFLCICIITQTPHNALLLKITLFCWGGIVTSIYTTALTAVGQEYDGSELIAANTSFGLLWGLGGFMPLIGGQATVYFGGNGLLYTAMFLTLLFIFLMALSIRRPSSRKTRYPS
ncbi:MFS transporter [Kiloniella antarctica]|uniref:MFS transporter n=1 Tax=Kiloniella antarctica TaxID=1550907 RepID=A0ABW5BG80_9PROT